MSASSLRYQPKPDRNVRLREQIVTLAQRHRRYGSGMILPEAAPGWRTRQSPTRGAAVRIATAADQAPTAQEGACFGSSTAGAPLGRQRSLVEWISCFDRIASGRSLKILGIVDDGTHEAVAVHPEHAIGGEHLVRVLERICASRGYPRIIRTGNAKEFTGKAMLTWGYEHGVKLRLIEPGKPNQNAYIESFNGRFRDECLNEHWFLNLRHARILINGWRREYNEERPKQGLGGLTPSQYAEKLATKSVTLIAGL